MGYYSLKVSIHNNDIINNSSLGLLKRNESSNQQFLFILYTIGERSEVKSEGTRMKENDLDVAPWYNSCRTVSDLHPWLNLPNNASRTSQRRNISSGLDSNSNWAIDLQRIGELA